jgi:superfamily I DNA and/or RNA helicase
LPPLAANVAVEIWRHLSICFQKNSESQGEPEFDLVIMDEASKATPGTGPPLTLGKER